MEWCTHEQRIFLNRISYAREERNTLNINIDFFQRFDKLFEQKEENTEEKQTGNVKFNRLVSNVRPEAQQYASNKMQNYNV